LRTNRKYDFEPYWQDEKDWLCIVEFLPTDNPQARLFAADIVGYLVGYANLTNTRSLGLNLTFGSAHSGSPRGGRRRSCGNHPWAMNVVCDSFNLVVDHIHTNC